MIRLPAPVVRGTLPSGTRDFLGWLNDVLRRALFLPEQASTYARGIDSLHYLEITTMFGMALLIALAVGFFLLRYRRKAGVPHQTPRITAPAWLELSVLGGLLTVFVIFWRIGFSQFIATRDAPPESVEVYVTAKQWMWKFAYADGPSSAGVLYVPAGRPVKLILTSRDVVHSFFVPAFRLKQDAVPGMFTTVWFEAKQPGRYRVMCAELCGVGHSVMGGEVVALDASDYDRWVEGEAVAPSDRRESIAGADSLPVSAFPLSERGERVAAEQGCLSCHTSDGRPHIGPTWLGLYRSRVRTDQGEVVANEAYLTESMMDPQARIVTGYAPVMPTYQGRIAPADVAALLEYIKSLRGAVPDSMRSPVVGPRPGRGGVQ